MVLQGFPIPARRRFMSSAEERRAQLASLDCTHREGKLQLITLISEEQNRGWGENQLGCIFAGWHLGEDLDSFEIWARSCWQQPVSVNPFCSKVEEGGHCLQKPPAQVWEGWVWSSHVHIPLD